MDGDGEISFEEFERMMDKVYDESIDDINLIT